ncbi:MAG TPA: ABC transporter substrate-binding protein [Desulfobaccales bacterium]
MKGMKPGGKLSSGLILALAVNLATWIPGAGAATPMEDIKGLVNEVQTILQTHSQKAECVDLIEKVTMRHMDFRAMSKRCLGSTWTGLSSAQKNEFVQLFSDLMKASYAKHLDEFVQAKVNYQGESCDNDAAQVRISVVRPNDRIPVNFRLLKEPQGWMIYDLVIDGVSMVSNYQCQFARAINAISYQGLLSRLKAHLKAESHGKG